MRVKDNEFPVVVQAYDTKDRQDLFVAEQVVHSQIEVNDFTSRYAGKLIKVRLLNEEERNADKRNPVTKRARKRSSGAGIWLLLLLVIVALVIAGFATGWIQRTFGIDMNF